MYTGDETATSIELKKMADVINGKVSRFAAVKCRYSEAYVIPVCSSNQLSIYCHLFID